MDVARHRARRAIANKAHAKVRKAVLAGRLPRLDGSIKCTDCDSPADRYDHREYAKPLQVEPVCINCNKRRGPAIDSHTALFPKRRAH